MGMAIDGFIEFPVGQPVVFEKDSGFIGIQPGVFLQDPAK